MSSENKDQNAAQSLLGGVGNVLGSVAATGPPSTSSPFHSHPAPLLQPTNTFPTLPGGKVVGGVADTTGTVLGSVGEGVGTTVTGITKGLGDTTKSAGAAVEGGTKGLGPEKKE